MEYRVSDARAAEGGGMTAYNRPIVDPMLGRMSAGSTFQVMVRADSPEEAAELGAARLGLPVGLVVVESYDDPGVEVRVNPTLQRQLEAERGSAEITGVGL